MPLGVGAGGERAVVAVKVGAVVHEVWFLLDPGVAGAGGGLRGAARDADAAASEAASCGDETLVLGAWQVEADAGDHVGADPRVPEVGDASCSVALVDVSPALFFWSGGGIRSLTEFGLKPTGAACRSGRGCGPWHVGGHGWVLCPRGGAG